MAGNPGTHPVIRGHILNSRDKDVSPELYTAWADCARVVPPRDARSASSGLLPVVGKLARRCDGGSREGSPEAPSRASSAEREGSPSEPPEHHGSKLAHYCRPPTLDSRVEGAYNRHLSVIYFTNFPAYDG